MASKKVAASEEPSEGPLRFSLLSEEFFSVRCAAGQLKLTLPQVLAALAKDEVEGFQALQPHQQHAWHAFTVQLAAIALQAQGKSDPRQSAETWAKWLRALTDGAEEPWCLVVGDLSKPAFMQPPIPGGSLTSWKGAGAAPDEIDLLVTAKNHDVKVRRIDLASAEHWLYALVSLQTMQGFLGAGNYGIARMNGGFSNRPGIGFADGLSLGARFKGDVAALLKHRDDVLDAYQYSADPRPALLWTLPWDGSSPPLQLKECDPFFIEVCRRVRLRIGTNGQIEALGIPTKAARVANSAGLTGDAWTPVGEKAALTVSGGGFHYELVSDLLFDPKRFRLGAAMQPDRGRKDPFLIAQALVRGQGKTEGLHQRILPLTPRIEEQLADPEARMQLALAARARIDAVEKVRKKALKPALCALFQGAPEDGKLDYQDDRPQRWLNALEDEVDRDFFADFFQTYHSEADDGLDGWKRRVGDLAHAQLQAAMHGGPVPTQRRYAAETMAEAIFRASFAKHLELPLYSEAKHDEPSAG